MKNLPASLRLLLLGMALLGASSCDPDTYLELKINGQNVFPQEKKFSPQAQLENPRHIEVNLRVDKKITYCPVCDRECGQIGWHSH